MMRMVLGLFFGSVFLTPIILQKNNRTKKIIIKNKPKMKTTELTNLVEQEVKSEVTKVLNAYKNYIPQLDCMTEECTTGKITKKRRNELSSAIEEITNIFTNELKEENCSLDFFKNCNYRIAKNIYLKTRKNSCYSNMITIYAAYYNGIVKIEVERLHSNGEKTKYNLAEAVEG